MTQFIATTAILFFMACVQLGNLYYTYGIWPKSWGSFTLFFILGMIGYAIFDAIRKENK